MTAIDLVTPENNMQITVAEDLAVGIGDQIARLSPGEAFRLAEKLIRAETGRAPSRAYPAQRRAQEIDEAVKTPGCSAARSVW
jgi:hypothetical protein